MGKIIVTRNLGGIEGLCTIEPKVFEDNRGYLKEVYNRRDFIEEGLNTVFVQDNVAFSKKNVLRGFHVNVTHPQAKLICVISGEIYDVAIDLRKNSCTYKKWYGIKLSSENHKQLYIPEGFGHGYLALRDSFIQFKVTTHYLVGDAIGFAWNSTEIGVNWPIINPILNEKDEKSPEYFDLMI